MRKRDTSISNSEYYQAHREELKAKRRAYYQAHKEECKAWLKKYRHENGEKTRAWKRKWRDLAFEILGKSCIQCGLSDTRILHIDHVNGDGHVDRKKGIRGYKMWYQQIEQDPDRFQVLCPNCHAYKTLGVSQ